MVPGLCSEPVFRSSKQGSAFSDASEGPGNMAAPIRPPSASPWAKLGMLTPGKVPQGGAWVGFKLLRGNLPYLIASTYLFRGSLLTGNSCASTLSSFTAIPISAQPELTDNFKARPQITSADRADQAAQL